MASLTDFFDTNIACLKAAFETYETAAPEGGKTLIDPRDGTVVGSHYALSHFFAALLLGSDAERLRAKEMLKYITATQEHFLKFPDYHYDFNNFIWALLLTLHRSGRVPLEDEIRAALEKLLLGCGDSRHMTLNWLPMRAWSNLARWEITGCSEYRRKAEKLLAMVRRAQDRDGLFGDRVKLGHSANPQYHAYTAAVLTLGHRLGVWQFPAEALERAMRWLEGVVLPDGDFNFFGRGVDQIFAWGPWFYLLTVNGIAPGISGDHFSRHLPETLKRGGLMLEHEGNTEERFWRSYHHASVYQAHLCFWLTLARKVADGAEIRKPLDTLPGNRSGAYIFRGMRDMLPERGPLVAALWTPELGVCFKGPLGNVAHNAIGAKEGTTFFEVLANYCGLIRVGRRWGFDYLCSAVFPKRIAAENPASDVFELRFSGLPRPRCFYDWLRYGIDIRKRYREYFYFQLPVFRHLGLDDAAVNRRFEVVSGERSFPLRRMATVANVYGDVDVYSTAALPRDLENISLLIKDPRE